MRFHRFILKRNVVFKFWYNGLSKYIMIPRHWIFQEDRHTFSHNCKRLYPKRNLERYDTDLKMLSNCPEKIYTGRLFTFLKKMSNDTFWYICIRYKDNISWIVLKRFWKKMYLVTDQNFIIILSKTGVDAYMFRSCFKLFDDKHIYICSNNLSRYVFIMLNVVHRKVFSVEILAD